MLATILLAAQSTVLPLSYPLEADSAFRAAYLPDGTGVLVTHAQTSNATLLPVTQPFVSETAEVGHFGSPAVSPDGLTAVVAGLTAGNAGIVTVLDVPSLNTRASLSVPFSFGGEVLIDSTSRWAVVLPSATDSSGIEVTILDLMTDTVSATIPLGGGSSPRKGVLAGAGTTLIAAGVSGQDYALFAIDLPSGSIVGQLLVDGFVKGLDVSSDGQSVAALVGGVTPSTTDSEILVVDPNTLAITAEWELPLPWDQLKCQIEFADSDQSIYVAGDRRASGDALRLALTSGTVQTLGMGPTTGVFVSADSERVFFLSPVDDAPAPSSQAPGRFGS